MNEVLTLCDFLGAAQGPGGMPFMHNMNFLRMGPHGMQGTPYGAGRYPFPHGMGGGDMGMGDVGMGGGPFGMGGGFGGARDMRFVHRGMGNGLGMGMGMGMSPGMGMGMGCGGPMAPGWWDTMGSEEEEEGDEDEDEAFWDEEEMSDTFTSHLKGQRGKRKGPGFGGMLLFYIPLS